MSNNSEVSPSVKGGLAVVAGGSAVALGATYWQRWEVLAILIVGGALVVGLLLLLFKVVVGRRERGRANVIANTLVGIRSNQDVNTPEDRAKIDQLATKFQEGVDIYRAAGKNLYSLPWYVLVGEPGSGKTEMLRHSDVPVPHGLADLPGVGGTINMNWWFTDRAVVLDTAGRIMFQQVEAGKTTEWKTFLELLKKARPNCPINGLLLVIPAESLIRDNMGKVTEKARKIARQFDLIQRTLDIRFPVFIVVTKSDLINGFRSFFEKVEIQDQGQMLGWSNPSKNLDDPFDPEEVDRHLSDVRRRLLKRRTALLLDPVSKENPPGRRTDEVDDLYAFPDALLTIGPRLQQYLSTIFVAGEWSPKPLFLRGIYFTSSMRQGAALDTELAQALGMPVESLPEGRLWKQDESFFLKDMFLRKVFPEKGLVTRQSKAQGLDSRRKAIVLTAAAASVVALLTLTYFGKQQMEQAILTPAEFWRPMAANYEEHVKNRARYDQGVRLKETEPYWQIVSKYQVGETGGKQDVPTFVYNGGRQAYAEKDPAAPLVVDMHRAALAQVKQELSIPVVFRPVAAVQASLTANERLDAYRTILEQTVLAPLVQACQEKMRMVPKMESVPRPFAAVEADALRELIRIEAMAGAPASADAQRPPLDLKPLFRYVLDDGEFEKVTPEHLAALQKSVDWVYGTGNDADGKPKGGVKFPPADAGGKVLLASQSDDPSDPALAAIAAGVERFNQVWRDRLAVRDGAERDADVVRLRKKLKDLSEVEAAVREEVVGRVPAGAPDAAGYRSARADVLKYAGSLSKMAKEADDLLAKVKAAGVWKPDDTMLTMYVRELKRDVDEGTKAYTQFQAEAIAGPRLQRVREALRAGRDALPAGDVSTVDKTTQEAFTQFQESFLWPQGKPTDVPAYRSYVSAYEVVAAQLPEVAAAGGAAPVAVATAAPGAAAAAAAAGGPAGGSLDERLAAIRAGVQKASADAAAKAQAGTPPLAGKVAAACDLVMQRLAGPAQRHVAIADVLDRMPASAAQFADAVAKEAAGAGRAGRKLGALPFTDLAAPAAIDTRYDAAAAKGPLAAWRAAAQRLEAVLPAAAPSAGAAGTEPVLEPKALRDRLDKVRAGTVDPYVIAYAFYWCDLAAKARTVPPASWKSAGSPAKDWEAFAREVPADAKTIKDALEDVRTVVADALMGVEAPPAEQAKMQAELAATKLPDGNAKERQAAEERVAARGVVAVNLWRRLTHKDGDALADPATAAYKAEAVGAAKFWDDYMVDASGSVSADYWSRVTRLGLDRLSKAAPDRAAEAANLVGKLSPFPIGLPKAGEAPLTAAAIPQLKAEIAGYLARAAAADRGRTDLAGKSAPPWFGEAYAKLVTRGPTADQMARLTRARLILDACGGQVTVANVLLTRQQELAAATNGAAVTDPTRITIMRLKDKGNDWPASYPNALRLADAVLGTLPLTDAAAGEAKFEVREAAPFIPVNLTKFKDPIGVAGPWAPIRLLQQYNTGYDALPGAPDQATTWYVELPQPNATRDGRTAGVWVKLVFPKPLPTSLKAVSPR